MSGESCGVRQTTVLLVGDADVLGETLERAKPEDGQPLRISRIDGYLSALGHLGTTDAEQKPDVIIGHVDDLDEPAAPTASALRRLCPHARLLLVARADSQTRATRGVEAGFDACLIEPVGIPELIGAIRRGVINKAHAADALSGLSRVRAVLGDVRRNLLGIQAFTASSNGSAVSPAAAADGELGDVDLIDHLLTVQSDIGPLAIRTLAGHAGIPDLVWAPCGDEVPPDHAAARVELRGTNFGALHAPPPATCAQLESWAGWLARWLSLERTINQLWDMALRDELTGVYNRRYLIHFLDAILAMARRERFHVTLLVFDIDNFKLYNDRYGHMAGDQILRESARLMRSLVRGHDVVARMGRDEFAVVFWESEHPRHPESDHPATIRQVAERFQQAIYQHRFPKLADEAPGALTISGGLATYPWDGHTSTALFETADQMAMQSKREGKNAIMWGSCD